MQRYRLHGPRSFSWMEEDDNGDYVVFKDVADKSQAASEAGSAELALLSAKALLTHAVFGMFRICGNSYANAYITGWLEQAKKLGAYHGETVGDINYLRDDFNEWLDENGGLPTIPTGT